MKVLGKQSSATGFTLIEIIAVLAILAILAAALTPSLIKSIDQAVFDKESRDLQSYADALQRSIQRNRFIPGQDLTSTNWATVIANEVGVSEWTIRTNSRYFHRRFVIDPALQVGSPGSGLPYTQGTSGSFVTNGTGFVVPPINPRVMLISSIGQQDVPSTITNVNTADFRNIWNSANSTNPLVSLGWTGNAEDLIIQRINLSGLFAHLLIFNYPPIAPPPWYSIDGQFASVPPNGTNIYVIKNTVLGLMFPDRTTTNSEQIINQDSTFVYDGTWRSSIYGSGGFSSRDSTALNSSVIADNFLASRLNLNSAVTQSNVVNSIILFMNAYSNYWASPGEFTFGQAWTISNQLVMVNALGSLINNPVPGNCR